MVSVSYRHSVVGILVGIFGTVPFGGSAVLMIWRELIARVSTLVRRYVRYVGVLILRCCIYLFCGIACGTEATRGATYSNST
jgi:hypothetical protein